MGSNIIKAALAFGIIVASSVAFSQKTTTAILPASIIRVESISLPLAVVPKIGSGWRGLVCNLNSCELRPVDLHMPKPDGRDTQQIIRWHRPATYKPVRGEYTIALLAGVGPADRTPVPTWYTLRTQRTVADAVNGSMGVSITPPSGETLRVLPRWSPSARRLTLYAEQLGKQTALGHIPLQALEHGIKPRDILIWAGDIDTDGRPDFITRVAGDAGTQGLHLWLSSKAQNGALVGLAASLPEWTDVEEAEGC